MRKLTIIAVVTSIFTAHATLALDTATHQYFNEDIAVKSLNGFSLDSYMKNTLGMQEGVPARM